MVGDEFATAHPLCLEDESTSLYQISNFQVSFREDKGVAPYWRMVNLVEAYDLAPQHLSQWPMVQLWNKLAMAMGDASFSFPEPLGGVEGVHQVRGSGSSPPYT